MNQPINQPTIPEVVRAQVNAYSVHDFAREMLCKMNKHQERFDTAWYDKSWTDQELKMEIHRCLLENDPVSAANYCMMLNHARQQNGASPSAVGQ